MIAALATTRTTQLWLFAALAAAAALWLVVKAGTETANTLPWIFCSSSNSEAATSRRRLGRKYLAPGAVGYGAGEARDGAVGAPPAAGLFAAPCARRRRDCLRAQRDGPLGACGPPGG